VGNPIVLTEIVKDTEDSPWESVIVWPTFPQNLHLDVKQQHFPKKDLGVILLSEDKAVKKFL